MKKIFLLFAFLFQLLNAQTTPLTGEYISIDRSSPGINLMLNNDKTFQLFVFSGTYEVVNDSIIFNESLESKQKNYFNVKFSKTKSTSKKIKFSVKPSLMMSLTDDFLGTQSKENGEITYISIYDYLKENNDEDAFRNSYLEDEDFQFSFELDKPYAIYLVSEKSRENIAKIEKYIIPSDVTEIAIENNFSLFDNLKLAGNVSDDQSINLFVERKPMKFVNKQKRAESTIFEKPASKTTEKNWTYVGKKDRFSIYDDSTSVVVDTTAVEYEEYNEETAYKFVAKVETSFEDAIKNLKNKYLVIYYNPKSKDQKKEFDEIIKDYNETVSYEMYEGYVEESDKFNFYLATSKDEKYFTANGITKFPATIIVDEKKQLLASSKNKYRTIANDINRYSFIEKVEATKNAIQIDEILNAKKTDNTKLAKLLADEDENFYSRFLDIPLDLSDEFYDNEVTDSTASVVTETVENYYTKSFTFYKLKTTQATFNQKIKDLFVSFQAKKIVDEELIGILLNEITNNHNSLKYFDKENTISKEDIKKYLAYAITYNGDKSKKVKILNTVTGYILSLEDKNDIAYEEMTKSMMLSSNYDAFQTKTYLEVVSKKSGKIEDSVYAVNQFYNNINANQSVFENLNTLFDNMNDAYKRNSNWDNFKNLYSSVFALASENIIKQNETAKFSDVQKWLDCANKISRDNLEVIKVSYDYYTIIGNKAKAEEFKAKFDILNKE